MARDTGYETIVRIYSTSTPAGEKVHMQQLATQQGWGGMTEETKKPQVLNQRLSH